MAKNLVVFFTVCSGKFDSWIAALSNVLRLGIVRTKILVMAVLILFMVVMSASQITGADIEKDAQVNLRFAHNLTHHGVFSDDEKAPYLPSNSREPIPNIVTSLHLRQLALMRHDMSFSKLLEDEGTIAVKHVNLYWVVLGLTATALLIQAFTDSFLLVLITTFLVGYFFFAVPMFVDTLYTELHASVLLLWSSWFLLQAVTKGRRVDYLLLGLSFGLLSLTKAIFFYVCLLIMAGLLLRSFWLSRHLSWGRMTIRPVVLMLGFAVVVMPWIVRNRVQLGTFQLTQRGGRVMYVRALENMMENSEIPGSIYFWGPSFYQFTSRLLGLTSPEDFQRGGRYQRINRYASDFEKSDIKAAEAGRPEDVISYRRKGVAEINRLTYLAAARGEPDPYRYAEMEVGKKARQMILSHPLRHLIMTPTFLWRGIWSWPNEGVNFKGSRPYVIVKDLLALAGYLALFALFILGLIRRNGRLLAITLLPVALLLAYGFLTHNVPRYSSPAIPLMIVSMVVVLQGMALSRLPASARCEAGAEKP